MPQSERTGKCRWNKSCREPPVEGRAYCLTHLAANRAKAKRYSLKHREKHRIKNRNLRHNRITRGLCANCGKATTRNYHKCERCLQLDSDHQVVRKQGGIRTRCSKRNPQRNDWIVARLKQYEPYLTRDWTTAEPWIRQHIELWEPNQDNALFMSVELKELSHMFNVYLDGCVNYLENGVRLGSYITGGNAG